jgi:hypothetical protein
VVVEALADNRTEPSYVGALAAARVRPIATGFL